MTDISIDLTVAADFLKIAELDRIAWSNNANSQFITDGEHAWRIWCEHALMYTAHSGQLIVGAILAFQCENGTYCLHKVMVSPEYRGKKIGSLLFKALLNNLDSKNAGSFLTVDPDNIVAISLYNRWGYEVKERVNGYYRSCEDRYIMIRKPETRS